MDPIFEYLTGEQHPHHPALMLDFEARSRAAAAHHGADLDLAYGPHPRQRFDFFAAAGSDPADIVLCYFHAGYWQVRDKSGFGFIASPFVEAGLAVALVNYPLCPDVTLDELVAAAAQSAKAVVAHAEANSGRPARLILAGHSAGAHIAVELAARGTTGLGIAAGSLSGVVGLSGVYEPAPLIETPLNKALRLDAAAAERNSPLRRLPAGLPPAVFAVGGGETPEFRRQTRAADEAWRATGAASRTLVVDGDDHFTLLETLVDPTSELHRAVLDLAA